MYVIRYQLPSCTLNLNIFILLKCMLPKQLHDCGLFSALSDTTARKLEDIAEATVANVKFYVNEITHQIPQCQHKFNGVLFAFFVLNSIVFSAWCCSQVISLQCPTPATYQTFSPRITLTFRRPNK